MTDGLARPPLTLDDLRARRAEILALAAKHGAGNVRVFGSVARGEAAAGSDVDLLVDFAADASLYDLSALRLDLIALLGHEVDIVELHERTSERFRRRIIHEAVAL